MVGMNELTILRKVLMFLMESGTRHSKEFNMEQQLTLNFTRKAHDDLEALSKRRGTSPEELVLQGCSLIGDVFEAIDSGKRVTVRTEGGRAVKEIVLP